MSSESLTITNIIDIDDDNDLSSLEAYIYQYFLWKEQQSALLLQKKKQQQEKSINDHEDEHHHHHQHQTHHDQQNEENINDQDKQTEKEKVHKITRLFEKKNDNDDKDNSSGKQQTQILLQDAKENNTEKSQKQQQEEVLTSRCSPTTETLVGDGHNNEHEKIIDEHHHNNNNASSSSMQLLDVEEYRIILNLLSKECPRLLTLFPQTSFVITNDDMSILIQPELCKLFEKNNIKETKPTKINKIADTKIKNTARKRETNSTNDEVNSDNKKKTMKRKRETSNTNEVNSMKKNKMNTNLKTTNLSNCPDIDLESITTFQLIQLSMKKNSNIIAILDQLQSTQKVGWLRMNEAKKRNHIYKQRSQLNNEENELVLKLAINLKPIYNHANAIIAYAWNVSCKKVNRIMNKAKNSNNLNVIRKKRCDTGITFYNSEKKRNTIITPYHIFKKSIRYEYHYHNDKSNTTASNKNLTINEIKLLFSQLSTEQLKYYELLAEEQKLQLLLSSTGNIDVKDDDNDDDDDNNNNNKEKDDDDDDDNNGIIATQKSSIDSIVPASAITTTTMIDTTTVDKTIEVDQQRADILPTKTIIKDLSDTKVKEPATVTDVVGV